VENYERRNSRQFAALWEEVLGEGFAARFRVSGTSMMPNIVEDDDVGGGPAAIDEIANGDVVLMQAAGVFRVTPHHGHRREGQNDYHPRRCHAGE
jgi:hypothetical protein